MKYAGLFLLLGSCTTATNLAASFIPAFNQEIDTSELKSGTYQLDPRHSALHMSFDHMGFSRTVGRFDSFEATLVFDKENPGTAQLTVTIDAASINTNYGELDELLTGKDFFDVEKYPEFTFTSDVVYFRNNSEGQVPGTLVVHGEAREVVLDITFNGGAKNWISGDYTLGFAASATFNRSDFGVKRLLPLTGDEVRIEIQAEFQRKGD
ncbi:MAG: YceI family protein [Sphingomonadales bacterium]